MATQPTLTANKPLQTQAPFVQGTGTEVPGQQGSGFNIRGTVTTPTPTQQAGVTNQPAQQPVQPKPISQLSNPGGAANNYTGNDQTQTSVTPPPAPGASDNGALAGATTFNAQNPNGPQFNASTLLTNENQQASSALTDIQTHQSALDKQIAFEESQAKQQLASNTGAINGQLAQGREGVISTGNTQAAQSITGNMQAVSNQQQNQLAEMQRQQDLASQNGQTELAKSYGAAIQDQQQKMLKTQQDQQTFALNTVKSLSDSGILTNATPDQIQALAKQYNVDPVTLSAAATSATRALGTTQMQQQFDNQTKALTSIQGMIATGTSITLPMAQQFAQETGLPVGSLMQYNASAESIMQNKNLDTSTKQTQLDTLNQTLKNEQQGIYTSAAQNVNYLNNLYNTNADPSVISAFKQAAGINDYSDPMMQAKLQYQTAQTDTERQNAYINAINNGLNPGAVIPQGGNYQASIDPKTGQFTVEPPDGTKAGQCGHYVNQVFGDQVMPDSYNGKLAQCDKSIGFGPGQTPPTPGMAFVMPISQSDYGHTGIFLGVDPNKPGMAQVKDSNWNNNETVSTHDIPLSQISGYATPPNATSSNGNVSNMSNQQILKNADMQGQQFKTVADQNKYIAAVRAQGFLPGQSQTAAVKDLHTPIPGVDVSLNDILTSSGNQSSAGKGYLTQDDIANYDSKQKAAIAQAAAQNGMKILTSANATSEQSITQANSNLKLIEQAFNNPAVKQALATPGIGAGLTGTAQQIAEKIQSNPRLSALSSYATVLPQIADALSGLKSLRGGEQYNASQSALPLPTDSAATIAQKLQNLRSLLNAKETTILGTPSQKDQIASIQSPIIKNFLDDPNASQTDKDALLKDLQSGYSEKAGENAVQRHFGTKYSQPTTAETFSNYQLPTQNQNHINSSSV